LGIARAENLVEATQNADVFVEVSGILKALAASLLKVATDLRWMASGPEAGLAEIRLPARQAGSTIMPGKVNPVIPEAVSQAAIATAAQDQAIFQAVSMGALELSQFLPLVADSLLTSLDLLTNACDIFARLCVEGIEANVAQCRAHVHDSTATLTALVEVIGYEQTTHLAAHVVSEGKSIRQLVLEHGWLTPEQFDDLTSPERVARLGSPSVKQVASGP
jgi:aspartate ammonia-lyase